MDDRLTIALNTINSLNFDALDIASFALKLLPESDTGRILMFSSYMEDRLAATMKLYFWHVDSNNKHDALFGNNGPLDSFSSRTLIAYHLGWLSTETKNKLDSFRKVRNELAHNAFRLDFDDPVIATNLKKIDCGDLPKFFAFWMDDHTAERGNWQNNLVTNLIFLAFQTFQDLIILPSAVAFRIRPQELGDLGPRPLLTMYKSLGDALKSAGLPPK